MNTDDENSLGPRESRDATALPPIPSALEFDATRYLPHVDGYEMTDDQKRELLETLWDVMRMFVELGLSVDICAQLTEGLAEPFARATSDDI